MAIFEAGIQQVNSSVGTVASLIWNPDNTSATTFGPLGSVPSTAVLDGLIIQNTGSVSVYVAMGSLSAASSTGIEITAGGQMYLPGYSASGGSTAGQIWGQTATVGDTSSTLAGLATDNANSVV